VSVIASNGAVTPEGNAEAAAAAVVVAADIPGKDLLVCEAAISSDPKVDAS
jgi:hypothetical protein